MMLSPFTRNASIFAKEFGPLKNWTYILQEEKDKNRFLVVDPAINSLNYINKILSVSKTPAVNIFLTHGHADHIYSVSEICDNYPESKIFMSKKDFMLALDPLLNYSSIMGKGSTIERHREKVVFVNESDKIKNGSEEYQIFETPGHTMGSLCLYDPSSKSVLTGDTVFFMSVGDTPDTELLDIMIKHVKNKILTLPDDTKVLPGHGKHSTILWQKQRNPFFI